ncbi:hypothetical protein NM208_g11455 [Fusarium decemcellulare]|uniref:Uncharacterized protein n=1 Tax=Fusarium decemcellulare TaxID=57161 RepID=A0ACC1RUP8_9HYPO|nr:hypothetical protein NM208_g11455 [Fusarium decemcellulare]
MNEALLANPERLASITSRIPAGNWGSPDDFKGTAVYLASKASGYVSGHVLVVDGGWMGRPGGGLKSCKVGTSLLHEDIALAVAQSHANLFHISSSSAPEVSCVLFLHATHTAPNDMPSGLCHVLISIPDALLVLTTARRPPLLQCRLAAPEPLLSFPLNLCHQNSDP